MINQERHEAVKQLTVMLMREQLTRHLNMSERIDRYARLALNGHDAKTLSRAKSRYISAYHFITTNEPWYDNELTSYTYSLLEYLFAESLANKLRSQTVYYADQDLVDQYIRSIVDMCLNVDTRHCNTLKHEHQWLKIASQKLDELVLLHSIQTRSAILAVMAIKYPEFCTKHNDHLGYFDGIASPHTLLFPESMMDEALSKFIADEFSVVYIIATLTEQYLPQIIEHYEKCKVLDKKEFFKYQRDNRLTVL